MTTTGPFVGFVLTGGTSSRLGTDKALVVVDGAALAARVALALRGAGATEVVSVGGDAEALDRLRCFDRHLPDRWPGDGPLGGIITAIADAGDTVAVVLACDTPTITSAGPRALLEGLGDADVAMGVVDGRLQPLTAAWRTSTTLTSLLTAFESGERAPRAVLDLFTVTQVELDAREVADVDRPEDLARYIERPWSDEDPPSPSGDTRHRSDR